MNFDLSSATFTRIGSFRRQSMMEKSREKTNANNTVNGTGADDTSGMLPAPTTIININNNINADFDENKGKKTPMERSAARPLASYHIVRYYLYFLPKSVNICEKCPQIYYTIFDIMNSRNYYS